MNTAYQIASTLKRSIAPVQDRNYLTFIRSQQCCVSGSWRGVEAAHFGPRGRGQKADDLQALPLSRILHRQHHALGTARFARLHNLDIQALILEFNALYVAQGNRPKRPLTRVRLKPADLMEDAG
jgi:hypothetical protein